MRLSLPTLFLALTSLAASGRETLNFNPDWKFLKADPAGAAAPGFDDAASAGHGEVAPRKPA